MRIQHRARHQTVAVLLASLVLAACGGDATQPTPPPPPPPPTPVVVAVTPATATLEVGSSREFTAHVTNTATTGVTWSSSGGTIAGTGATITWTAPATAGTHTLTATSSADPTKQASAAITVTPPAPVVVVLDNAAISSSGGSVTVNRVGNPLHGLKVTVQPGTFASPTAWTVSELKEVRPTLPAGFKQVGPTIEIRNGQGFAQSPFALSIPIQVGPDSAVVALMRDPDSGTLELLPSIQRTDQALVVLTQHLSADQMLLRAPAAGLRLSAGVRPTGSPPSGTVQVITVAAALLDLGGTYQTPFVPSVAGWEFANRGSYLAPGGFCMGWTLSAIHHYYSRPGALFERYDDVAGFEYDNPRGVRLASVIQHETRQAVSTALTQELANARIQASTGAPGFGGSWVQLQMATLAMSMRLIGPQQLAVMPADNSTGHALIAIGMNSIGVGGALLVADPNHPGTEKQIGFGQQSIVPFFFADYFGAPEKEYTQVFVLGVSALMPVHRLDALWQELDADKVGDAEFARTVAQYLDPADTLWRDVTTEIKTASDDLMFRTVCTSGCVKTRGPAAKEPDRGLTPVFDGTGQLLGQDLASSLDGTDVPIPDGSSNFGLGQYVYSIDLANNEFLYADFAWTKVTKVPFTLEVDPAEPLPGQTVTLTVDNSGIGNATMRYRWIIDGGAPEYTAFNTPTLERVMPPDPLSVEVSLVDATNHALAKIDSTITPEEYTITLEATPDTIARSAVATLTVTLDPAYTGQGLAYRYLSAQAQGQVSPPVGIRSSNTTATYTAKQWATGGTETVRVEVVVMDNGTEIGILGHADATIEVDPFHLGSYGVVTTGTCVVPFIFIPKVVGATQYEVIADRFNHPTIGTMYTRTFSGPSGGTAVFDVQETGSDFRIRMEGGGCAISDAARQAMITAMNMRFAGIRVRVKATQ